MSKEDIQKLKALYPITPNAKLSMMLGMSTGMVQRRAYQLGLRKDGKYLSEVNSKAGRKGYYALEKYMITNNK